jgi:hypothetical protein
MKNTKPVSKEAVWKQLKGHMDAACKLLLNIDCLLMNGEHEGARRKAYDLADACLKMEQCEEKLGVL